MSPKFKLIRLHVRYNMNMSPTHILQCSCTTGNSMFAECSTFCRVYFFVHSANKVFAECHKKTLGKINTHGKQFFAECIIFQHSAKMRVCRVFFLHSANSFLPSVLFLALGKDHNLPSVFIYTWQRIKFFLTSNPKTFSTLHIQHVLLHVKISYIFVFVCYN